MKNSVKNTLKIGAGFIAGLVLAAIVPLAIVWSGLIDMSATPEPGKIESALAPWAFDCSMKHHAPAAKNPFANSVAVLPAGLGHYRENCVVCHGAPDVKPADLAQGLNPPAPKLQTDDAQSLRDGEMFWIIQNGIRMTGMPAFGPTRSPEDIWHLVTFVRHLPKLTPAERAAFQAATRGEAEHHAK